MPKDREKYRYIDVGLERGSWALVMFEEDARKHHMSDQPGKLLALRLTEYYELKNKREVLSSRELPLENDDPVIQPSHEQIRSPDTSQVSEEDVLKISQQEAENADEAADYWIGV